MACSPGDSEGTAVGGRCVPGPRRRPLYSGGNRALVCMRRGDKVNATLAHDRSLRLFQFLREFTLLKAKPQRTSDNDTLLWLHSLPQEPEVQNAARREAQDTTPDVWLSVRKPKTTAPPVLPDALQPWVLARLDDSSIPPEPLKERLVTATVKDDDLRDIEIRDTLFFDQQPELLTLWEAYTSGWGRWAAGRATAK